jgi:cbb3-type cytochrome oxidase subunit 3
VNRLLVILFLFLTTGCAYHYSRSKRKELARADLAYIEFQDWYNSLVKREKDPIIIIETDILNESFEPKGNLLDYTLFNLQNRRFYDEDGFFEFPPDEEGPKLKRYEAFVEPFIEGLNIDSLRSILFGQGMKTDEIYLLIPLLTDSSSLTATKINNSLKFRYTTLFTEGLLGFSNGLPNIEELVKSDKLNSDFSLSDIPKPILDSLYNRVNFLKNFIPSKYYNKIESTMLVVMDPSIDFEPSDLWVKSDTNIYMSSRLLRAIIIEQLTLTGTNVLDFTQNDSRYDQNLYLYNFNNLNLKPIERRPSRNVPINKRRPDVGSVVRSIELNIAKGNFFKRLYRSTDFLILHELAHIYLNDPFDEMRCDCHAFEVLKMIRPSITQVDLGVFNYYLVNPGVRQSSLWFGTSNSELYSSLRIRKARLLEQIDGENIICD